MAIPQKCQYSASVELRLIADGTTYALSQLGPSFAITTEAIDLEPTTARIEVIVDKRVSTIHHVYLYRGIQGNRIEFF